MLLWRDIEVTFGDGLKRLFERGCYIVVGSGKKGRISTTIFRV
jgi:hypothetical protein